MKENKDVFKYLGDYTDNRPPAVKNYGSQTLRASPVKKKGKLQPQEIQQIIYPAESSLEIEGSPQPLDVKLYISADCYDVQALKYMAKSKYEETVVTRWNSSDFVASLKLFYEKTLDSDRLLKDVAIQKAGENAKALVDRGEFVNLCKISGEIGFDVLKASLTAVPKSCPSCGSDHATYGVQRGKGLYCNNCGRYN